jgi:hypothetical protein
VKQYVLNSGIRRTPKCVAMSTLACRIPTGRLRRHPQWEDSAGLSLPLRRAHVVTLALSFLAKTVLMHVSICPSLMTRFSSRERTDSFASSHDFGSARKTEASAGALRVRSAHHRALPAFLKIRTSSNETPPSLIHSAGTNDRVSARPETVGSAGKSEEAQQQIIFFRQSNYELPAHSFSESHPSTPATRLCPIRVRVWVPGPLSSR